jgi:hypothetical protein
MSSKSKIEHLFFLEGELDKGQGDVGLDKGKGDWALGKDKGKDKGNAKGKGEWGLGKEGRELEAQEAELGRTEEENVS